jgi:hypothetical protein
MERLDNGMPYAMIVFADLCIKYILITGNLF